MASVVSTNPTVQSKMPGVADARTPLPYVQEGQLLNAVKQPNQADLQQQSNQVMQTANQKAVQGATQPNQTMSMVEQGAQGLMKAPELVTQKYIANQMGQYDRNRADAMKAFQQNYADTANTGKTAEAAYNFAMQGAQGRTDLQTKLDFEAAEKNRTAQLAALGLGKDVATTKSGLDTDAFNRLLGARGAFEGERAQTQDQGFAKEENAIDRAFGLEFLAADQAGQASLTELKGKIDSGMLLQSQDFEGAQATLDRALADAKMKGDWANAEKITAMKGEIDQKAQESQQQWASTERIASQSWNTTERIGEQDFARATQLLDQKERAALQKNDIASAEKIAQQRIDLELTMQTQGMSHDEKMMKLNDTLETARANGDVERQKQIIGYQSVIDMKEMAQQHINTVGLMRGQAQLESEKLRLAAELEEAQAANDFGRTKQIQMQQYMNDVSMLRGQDRFEKENIRLAAQLEEAQAANDYGREKEVRTQQQLNNLELLREEGKITESEMKAEQGYIVARMSYQEKIDKAAAAQDHIDAAGLLRAQQTFTKEEAVLDRAIETTKVGLQQAGVDMAKLEQTYSFLMSEAEAGRADPNAAFDFVKGIAANNGITMNEADRNAIYTQIDNDYKQREYVFAQSNPDFGIWKDASGNVVPKGTAGATFSGLKDEGTKDFNEYLNNTYYGEDGKPIDSTKVLKLTPAIVADPTKNAANDPDVRAGLYGADKPENKNHAEFASLLAKAPDISISQDGNNKLKGVPKAGEYIKSGNRLFVITKGKWEDKDGRNDDRFEIMDVATGTKKTWSGFYSLTNSKISYRRSFNGWVEDLNAL